ncbi:tRNA pseudouridine(38-40) synthase TruA [Dyadobacter psychrotolerans]|uniref:tRNA pseudouridine synthase A n=1 Tax=Dyadobacter psychrotolerans TaxID=2541721 RepID=A0A4R5DZV6_9BACT|nr:tRNA pseudouridine(38-40) synthase TruA [Dyadobacter psychrotolerans]TDE18254.1 tRNA pseudouridine(38-40) synthase TruA [Dyadobacter psychrotolerans]
MRYFIELSYKGTAYNGWQKQNNSLGVQQVLEEAMSKILRKPLELTGSSRTDTGVHAEQQFAHFDFDEIQDTEKLVYNINGMIPRDVAVQRIFSVPEDTNSRFAATHRRYQYRISKIKNPFLMNQVYVLRADLDLEKMNQAAALLLQYFDFESFSKIHTSVNNFRCSISQAEWSVEDDLLIFSIQSNRFLRGMVRALVGTLLEVGKGKRTVADFEEVIKSRDRKKAGAQAPAEGLFLVEVGYPAELIPTS